MNRPTQGTSHPRSQSRQADYRAATKRRHVKSDDQSVIVIVSNVGKTIINQPFGNG
jgi:hypothetical protein